MIVGFIVVVVGFIVVVVAVLLLEFEITNDFRGLTILVPVSLVSKLIDDVVGFIVKVVVIGVLYFVFKFIVDIDGFINVVEECCNY